MAKRDKQTALERVYKSILEKSQDAAIVVSPTGDIVLVNQQTELLFGWDRHELVGSTLEMLLPESFRETHRANRIRFFADPRAREGGDGYTVPALHRNGQEFPIQVWLSALTVAGVGVLGLITARKTRPL